MQIDKEACRQFILNSKGRAASGPDPSLRRGVIDMKTAARSSAPEGHNYYNMPWTYLTAAVFDRTLEVARGSTITQDTEFESQRSSVWVDDLSTEGTSDGFSWTMVPPTSDELCEEEVHEVEPYHFSGVFHRFPTGRMSVTCVKFAHGEDGVIAIGTGVGAVMVCTALMDPAGGGPQFHRLDGHRATVTELEWGRSNQYLISCSLDRGLRVWDVARRVCVRSIVEDSPCLCLGLVPSNNNLVVVAFNKPTLKVYNMSTGKCLKKTSAKHSVGCLAWGENDIAHCGDAGGTVSMFAVHPMTSEMRRLASITMEKNKPVTSVTFQTVSVETAPRVKGLVGTVLASVRNNLVVLLHAVVNGDASSYTILRRVEVPHIWANIRSTRSAHKDGVCSVTGAEDGTVYIHNLTRLKVQCVARVLDPRSNHTVLCVALNPSENLLACGNAKGELVLWHRVRFDELDSSLSAHAAHVVMSDATTTLS